MVRQPYQVTGGVGPETPEPGSSRRLARRAYQPTAEPRPRDGSAPPAGPLVRDADQEPAAGDRVLVVGCGALARELVALTADLPGVDVACLPPALHNRPERIPAAVRDRVRRGRAEGYDRVFVAYADCGTGGLLDPVIAEEGVERLAGAHCYEFYATSPEFEKLVEDEPATFFLTDFLARNFDRLVIQGLGIDRHPELLEQYFGNYQRLVYLAQTDDPALAVAARRAARRLGLRYEHRHTGYGQLATTIAAVAVGRPAPAVTPLIDLGGR